MNQRQSVYSLWIINKSGGLVYDKNFLDSKALEVNALLKISGLFHGMHAISKQLAGSLPGDAERGGIECIEADGFRFQCFESMSGIKFLCSTDPHFARASDFLLRVYSLYSDYVLKNPFYEVDQFGIGQPIRVERFEQKVDQLVQELS